MARSPLAPAKPRPRVPFVWRSLKSADFALALAAPAVGKSAHFVLHYIAAAPASSVWRPAPQNRPLVPELSTDAAPIQAPTVDNMAPPHWRWLGLVVPKRYAKRSVTRSLLKRQMRAQAQDCGERLLPGQWVVRLRAPFNPRVYTSAASAPLRVAARRELEQVFAGMLPP